MLKDETSEWLRPLLIGVGSLFGVALLIGGVVSAVALGAAGVVGLGDSGTGPSEEPSLYIPSTSPTTSGSAQPEASPTPSGAPSKPATKTKKPETKTRIILSARPGSVGTYDRIDLTGRYPGGNGASVRVQRFEGRWVSFPTSASVRGGTFSTHVASGQTGKNRFRVVDPATGKRSNPVAVTVR